MSGPEPWATIAGETWCHFDRWFAIVSVADFAGDIDALERALAGMLRSRGHDREDLEAKLSHLQDLRTRTAAARIDTAALAAAVTVDTATCTKARQKVLHQRLEGYAMTAAMFDTPRMRLERRARSGHWGDFPVDPDAWHEKLVGSRPPNNVSRERSSAVTDRLSARLARHDKTCNDEANRLALHRAFHLVALDLAESSDWSFEIEQLRINAFTTYVSLDWAAAGMAAEHYWQDLCELLVSEPFSLTFGHETLPFRRVPPDQAEMIEAILLGLADDYRAAYQDYRAHSALALVAWLHIARRRYRCYVAAARRVGSDYWMPVEALATSAIAGGRTELAVEVFRAADRPGTQRDRLRWSCLALTGVHLDDTAPPSLRAAK